MAAKTLAQLGAELGPIDATDPHEKLLVALGTACGMQRAYEHLVARLSTSTGTDGLVGPDHLGDLRPHPYDVRLERWTSQVAEIAERCVRAKVGEARIEFVRGQARLVALAISGLADGLRAALEERAAAGELRADVIEAVWSERLPELVKAQLTAASAAWQAGEAA